MKIIFFSFLMYESQFVSKKIQKEGKIFVLSNILEIIVLLKMKNKQNCGSKFGVAGGKHSFKIKKLFATVKRSFIHIQFE